MKKWIPMITVFCLLFSLTACGAGSGTNGNTEHSSMQSQIEAPSSEPMEKPDVFADDPVAEPTEEAAKTLVVYFSATGNTKAVAEEIVRLTGADLYEIVPAVPYTNEDLNYNDNTCRANQEMNDASARPAIGSEAIDISSYDTVFIGFPIWWYVAPHIIHTFVESYDFSGKTLVPFATSGGSGMGRTVDELRKLCPNADWKAGKLVNGESDQALAAWAAKFQ